MNQGCFRSQAVVDPSASRGVLSDPDKTTAVGPAGVWMQRKPIQVKRLEVFREPRRPNSLRVSVEPKEHCGGRHVDAARLGVKSSHRKPVDEVVGGCFARAFRDADFHWTHLFISVLGHLVAYCPSYTTSTPHNGLLDRHNISPLFCAVCHENFSATNCAAISYETVFRVCHVFPILYREVCVLGRIILGHPIAYRGYRDA